MIRIFILIFSLVCLPYAYANDADQRLQQAKQQEDMYRQQANAAVEAQMQEGIQQQQAYVQSNPKIDPPVQINIPLSQPVALPAIENYSRPVQNPVNLQPLAQQEKTLNDQGSKAVQAELQKELQQQQEINQQIEQNYQNQQKTVSQFQPATGITATADSDAVQREKTLEEQGSQAIQTETQKELQQQQQINQQIQQNYKNQQKNVSQPQLASGTTVNSLSDLVQQEKMLREQGNQAIEAEIQKELKQQQLLNQQFQQSNQNQPTQQNATK